VKAALMRAKCTDADPAGVAARFALVGPVRGVQPYGRGNINQTHLVTCGPSTGAPRRYVLQRLNPAVFAEPDVVMANLQLVTAHLRRRLEAEGEGSLDRRLLRVVPTWEGRPSWRDATGAVWRCVDFVERTHSSLALATPAQVFEAGRAFGELHRLLVDLDPALVGETIPEFHDPVARLAVLERVLGADPAGRSDEAGDEIGFVLGHRDLAAAGRRLVGSAVPRRVAHNDAKVDNLLFDDDTDRVVCITDLDTIMPGSILWDVGHLLRSATCRAPEDERDLSLVAMDLDLARALLAAYRQESAGWITPSEVALLSLSGAVVVYEEAVRFLTDHLAGDVYFRIFRPGQNRDRCRVQIRLLASMLDQMPDLDAIVADVWGSG
jgi:aminoglycoside phosphotransferase (APT) family kinase protein